MNVIAYSLMCYAITAVISFMVIGIALVVNRVMSNGEKQNEQG